MLLLNGLDRIARYRRSAALDEVRAAHFTAIQRLMTISAGGEAIPAPICLAEAYVCATVVAND